MSSPPLTPIRNYMSSMEASSGQRQPLGHRRRSSSYSNNNRSPVTRRSSYSNHRLSNASRYSNGTSDLAIPSDGNEHSAESGGGGGGGVGGGGSGGGNLADELEFADEDAEWDENGLDGGVSGMSLADEVDETWEATQGASKAHLAQAHGHAHTLTAQEMAALTSLTEPRLRPDIRLPLYDH